MKVTFWIILLLFLIGCGGSDKQTTIDFSEIDGNMIEKESDYHTKIFSIDDFSWKYKRTWNQQLLDAVEEFSKTVKVKKITFITSGGGSPTTAIILYDLK